MNSEFAIELRPPIAAYQGSEPYVFVCYSHSDREVVYPEIQWLHDQGVNVWYDEGIAPGEEFPEKLGLSINGASQFLLFLSDNSAASRYCRNEVHFAMDQEKPLVTLYLSDTKLSAGLALILSTTQAILAHTLSISRYRALLLNALTNKSAPASNTVTPIESNLARLSNRVSSIVVLPFVDTSGEREYFADGITETLISNLSKISALKIISRMSSMRYKAIQKTAEEIAIELNVDAIVSGSGFHAGGEVRITAELQLAASDELLWSESYERDLTNILVLQRDLTKAIAAEIKISLTPGEATQLDIAHEVNPIAYETVLKGRFHWYKLTPQDLETALEYFQQALRHDSKLALAYSGIAEAWAGMQQLGMVSSEVAGAKMKEAAESAIALDDLSAESHYVFAVYKAWTEWDWPGAEIEFRRSIELNPNYPDPRAFYSHYLMIMQRPDEATEQIERALELDPFNVLFRALYAVVLTFQERYEDGVVAARHTLRIVPNHWLAFQSLRINYFKQGQMENCISATASMYRGLGDVEVADLLSENSTDSGEDRLLRAAGVLEDRARKTFVSASQIALLYDFAGDYAKAIEWLNKAIEIGTLIIPICSCSILESCNNKLNFKTYYIA